jgi:hypothetical protein
MLKMEDNGNGKLRYSCDGSPLLVQGIERTIDGESRLTEVSQNPGLTQLTVIVEDFNLVASALVKNIFRTGSEKNQ